MTKHQQSELDRLHLYQIIVDEYSRNKDEALLIFGRLLILRAHRFFLDNHYKFYSYEH